MTHHTPIFDPGEPPEEPESPLCRFCNSTETGFIHGVTTIHGHMELYFCWECFLQTAVFFSYGCQVTAAEFLQIKNYHRTSEHTDVLAYHPLKGN